MKKLIVLLLAWVLVFTLAACGPPSSESGSNEKPENNGEQTGSKPGKDDFVPDYKPEEKNYFGNTAANLLEQAYTAKQGDWIYYFAGSRGIEKRNDVTGETVHVTDTSGWQISVQGDYIYFLKSSHDKDYDELWRVRTDGEELTMISEKIYSVNKVGNVLFANACYSIAGEKIYMRQEIRQSNGDIKHCICKMNLDGTEVEPIAEQHPVGGLLGVTETQLFYHYSTICCIPIDGTDAGQKAFKPGGNGQISLTKDFTLEGDSVYYHSGTKIFQANADSPGNFTQLCNLKDSIENVRDVSNSTNVHNGSIYFGNRGLHILDIKTGAVKQLNESAAWNINVFDDEWIYYRDQEGLCRVRQDGTGWELLAKK